MASELKPTVVFKFMLNSPGVVIVVCSPGYRSGSIVAFKFVKVVIFIVKISFLWIYKKRNIKALESSRFRYFATSRKCKSCHVLLK